ncbi:hypothetical protein B6I21_03445 [candidate division KSB1 bacterium 4572_119]|nr:MAG: hypothetical protein B6I21_03445 [candidate division KSB1 bacterium 4572_119]
MKTLRLLVVFVLLVSISLLFLNGCAKKQEAEKAPETEQIQQAPADTTAPPPEAPEGEEGAEEATGEATE